MEIYLAKSYNFIFFLRLVIHPLKLLNYIYHYNEVYIKQGRDNL